MLCKRIIPCLDIKDGRVVKGVNFVSLRDAGDPVETAKTYNAAGADELVFLDITASSDGRKTRLDVISRASEQVFIPLTVGGGISSVEDFSSLLSCGADKIAVNSAAVDNPSLLSEAALKFGSQCVVLAVDAKSNGRGGWNVYKHGAHRYGDRRPRMGRPRGEAGRGGDPPHQHGQRRNQGGLRRAADESGFVAREYSRHRLGRGGQKAGLCRNFGGRRSGRGSRGVAVPFRAARHKGTEKLFIGTGDSRQRRLSWLMRKRRK